MSFNINKPLPYMGSGFLVYTVYTVYTHFRYTVRMLKFERSHTFTQFEYTVTVYITHLLHSKNVEISTFTQLHSLKSVYVYNYLLGCTLLLNINIMYGT